MRQITPVFKREFLGYFRSPVAYVVLIAFLMLSVALSFSPFGAFFKADDAGLARYFVFYPWLFLFLIPAVGMRLWSEEKRSGTVELLFTLPITTLDAVVGKFLAGWAFLAAGVLLSFPMALTVAYLGVCALLSSLTKNQVIAFVLGLIACAILLFLGYSSFTEFLQSLLPVSLADALANFSFLTHFDAFTKGIIDPRDVVFFLSLMGFTLFLNVVALER